MTTKIIIKYFIVVFISGVIQILQTSIIESWFSSVTFLYIPLVILALLVLYTHREFSLFWAVASGWWFSLFTLSPFLYSIGIMTGIALFTQWIYKKFWNTPSFPAAITVSGISSCIFIIFSGIVLKFSQILTKTHVIWFIIFETSVTIGFYFVVKAIWIKRAKYGVISNYEAS